MVRGGRRGTNAPGLALAVGHGVQIVGAEHYSEHVQEWSCAAAPVHDPVTGHVLGVLDVTGGRQVAAPFAMSTVRSVATAIELQSAMAELISESRRVWSERACGFSTPRVTGLPATTGSIIGSRHGTPR